MVVDQAGGDAFLLLPRVLLEGGASKDGLGVEGIGLLAVERLLERVRVEGGGGGSFQRLCCQWEEGHPHME